MTKKQTRKDHSNSQKLLPSSAKIKKPKKVLKKDAKAVGSQCVASVEEKSTFLDDLFKTASSKPTVCSFLSVEIIEPFTRCILRKRK